MSVKPIIEANNRCVMCGEIIPEGRQVCPTCERAAGEKVSLDKLFGIVLEKKLVYRQKYHTNPRFIKIPITVYIWLKVKLECGVKTTADRKEYLYGLEVCPTDSIDFLEEIELF